MAEEDKPKANLSVNEEEEKNSQEEMIPKSECESRVKTLQAELAAIKALSEQSQTTADARLAAIEEAYRKDKIKTLVTSRISDAKKADEIYKHFIEAKHTPEAVEKTLALFPAQEPQKSNTETFTGKPADASSDRTGSYAAFQSYRNSIIKGANA